MTHCIILAAGFGRRFREEKLKHTCDGTLQTCEKLNTILDGKPMYRHVLDHLTALAAEDLCDVTLISRPGLLADCPVPVTENPDAAEGIASSIRRGLAALPRDDAPVAFFVADQPWLKKESIRRFLQADPAYGILRAGFQGRMGNPVRFSRKYEPELMALRGDEGGRAVIRRHPEDVAVFELTDARELEDLDRPPAVVTR